VPPSLTFGPSVDAAGLLSQATAETGLDDFGRDTFRPSLERFADVMEASALEAPDRVAANGQMVNVLSWRLRMIADRKRYAAIADERIVAPIIVVGFPRCGTTLLHALLTECPGNRAPLWWELARPSPPPSLAPEGDPRVGQATRDMERWLAEYPGFLVQHPYHDAGAHSTMECEALMTYDLRNAYPMLLSKVPFFTPWADNADPAASYAAHHALLQHLQFGGPARRWVLKGVEHQYRLSALLERYPDAMLVWPHRDPVEVFGSLLAVTYQVLRFSGADISDPRGFSERMLSDYAGRVATALADPVAGSERVLHVRYPDFTADPVGTVGRVYSHFGLAADGVPEAVRGWLDDPANRPDRHGKWSYDLADFKVTEDAVRERFRDYAAKFGI
jgi:hypothetical protein